jgi:hypothetical protein
MDSMVSRSTELLFVRRKYIRHGQRCSQNGQQESGVGTDPHHWVCITLAKPAELPLSFTTFLFVLLSLFLCCVHLKSF